MRPQYNSWHWHGAQKVPGERGEAWALFCGFESPCSVGLVLCWPLVLLVESEGTAQIQSACPLLRPLDWRPRTGSWWKGLRGGSRASAHRCCLQGRLTVRPWQLCTEGQEQGIAFLSYPQLCALPRGAKHPRVPAVSGETGSPSKALCAACCPAGAAFPVAHGCSFQGRARCRQFHGSTMLFTESGRCP